MNIFEMVGKLSLGKESDKFKPVDTKVSAKGWKGTRLKFNLMNNTGFHNLELFEGFMQDGSSIVYCLKQKEEGKWNEPFEKMQVKWQDRLKPEIVSKVTSFNKYKIVLGQDNEKEFIAGIDFVEELIKVLKDDKYKDSKFKVEGNIEYNTWNDKTYKKLVPKIVTLVDSETPIESTIKLDLFFNNDCLDDSMIQDNGKYIVNGFVRQYDGTVKKDISFAESVIIDTSKAENDKQKRAFEIIKNRFITNDDKFYKMGIKCVAINGVEKVEITMDDLTEEEKELIEVGLATFEDFKKEYGSKNGDKITETKIVGFTKGFNGGAKPTDFVVSDFISADVTDELVMTEDDMDDLPF